MASKKELEAILAAVQGGEIDSGNPMFQALKRAKEKGTDQDTRTTPSRIKKKGTTPPPTLPVVRKPIADYHRQALETEAARIAAEQRATRRSTLQELQNNASAVGDRFATWINKGASNGTELITMTRDLVPVIEEVRGTETTDNEAKQIIVALGHGVTKYNHIPNPNREAYLKRFERDGQYIGVRKASIDRDTFFFIVAFETLTNMPPKQKRELHRTIVGIDNSETGRTSIESVFVTWLKNSPSR